MRNRVRLHSQGRNFSGSRNSANCLQAFKRFVGPDLRYRLTFPVAQYASEEIKVW